MMRVTPNVARMCGGNGCDFKWRSMILVGVTMFLALALAINHAIHGFRCWGFQPGGRISAMIYCAQLLTCIVGILCFVWALSRETLPRDAFQLTVISIFILASAYSYVAFGWRALTSIHHQGPENLVAYLTVATTTYLVGRYR